jgi:hypothetical protein
VVAKRTPLEELSKHISGLDNYKHIQKMLDGFLVIKATSIISLKKGKTIYFSSEIRYFT